MFTPEEDGATSPTLTLWYVAQADTHQYSCSHMVTAQQVKSAELANMVKLPQCTLQKLPSESRHCLLDTKKTPDCSNLAFHHDHYKLGLKQIHQVFEILFIFVRKQIICLQKKYSKSEFWHCATWNKKSSEKQKSGILTKAAEPFSMEDTKTLIEAGANIRARVKHCGTWQHGMCVCMLQGSVRL